MTSQHAPVLFATLLIATSALAQSLEGKWLGQASPQAGAACWTNERRSDGTYEVNFLAVTPSGNKRHREEGTWFSSNGLYATVTHRINGEDADPANRRLREIYRVIELNDSRFVYADLGSETRFIVTRVPNDFSLTNSCPSE